MSTVEAIADKARPARATFLAKQLFSLLGIVPIGVYVVVHLYNNGASVRGAEAYNRYLAESRGINYYWLLVLFFIYVPIVYHGLYGLWFTFRGRPNPVSYPFWGNLKYTLQRLSGLGLLLFIPAHVYLEKFAEAVPTDYRRMVEAMHHPPTFWVYVLGVLGVAYHLANGVWDFAFGWGLVTGPRGRRILDGAAVVLFLVIAALGYNAMRGFLVATP